MSQLFMSDFNVVRCYDRPKTLAFEPREKNSNSNCTTALKLNQEYKILNIKD